MSSANRVTNNQDEGEGTFIHHLDDILLSSSAIYMAVPPMPNQTLGTHRAATASSFLRLLRTFYGSPISTYQFCIESYLIQFGMGIQLPKIKRT